jgi:Tol biopolymer transport system component
MAHFCRCWSVLAVSVGAALLLIAPRCSLARQGETWRVSTSSGGVQGDGHSAWTAISTDGRYVAFDSYARNLVPGDTNESRDVFVHDRLTGEIERVSVSSSGEEGNGDSMRPAISGSGRYVAFQSFASNLVPHDTNETLDVFVHDRLTGITECLSVSAEGEVGDDLSVAPSISADGRYVAFESHARNLVPGGYRGVLLHDRLTGEKELVCVSSSGEPGNRMSSWASISADGTCIAFYTSSTNLDPNYPSGDDDADVYVRDRLAGTTELVSVSSEGERGIWGSGVPSISANGRYVSFYSLAWNLVQDDWNHCADVFVHDRATGETTRVSVSSRGEEGLGDSVISSISGDGRFVAFDSWADDLVWGDTNDTYDIFVHDRATGETRRVSVSSWGKQANENSFYLSLSGDGRYVAFQSYASNLVEGDSNGVDDVFVHQYLPGDVWATVWDGWLNPGWNWFSVPLDPAGWPDVSNILGFDCGGVVYRWAPQEKRFELYPNDFRYLERGHGYLLWLSQPLKVTCDLLAASGAFEIPLPRAGWTCIGQPFDHDTPLDDCTIRNNGTGQSRTPGEDRQAADPWLNWSFLWWHSGEDTWKILAMSGGDDNALHPWYGYLVWANVRDLTLTVPAE